MTRTDDPIAARRRTRAARATSAGDVLVASDTGGDDHHVWGEDRVLILWRKLRDRIPHTPPTVLDRLLADVLSGEGMAAADIRARLETAAATGDEPDEWAATLADEGQRELLKDVLQNLLLVERSSLGTPSARRLRDLPDSGDVVKHLRITHVAPLLPSHRERTPPTGRGTDGLRLSEADIRLLTQVASGVSADVAARKLELSARTLRRRLRGICDRLEVDTPIEAVTWAARHQLIGSAAPVPATSWDGQVVSILFADIVGFSAPHRNDDDRRFIRRAMYKLLQTSFEASGVPWDACHHEDRGDGALILVPAQTPPRSLVGPLVEHLTTGLRKHNHRAAEPAHIQLRLAMHVGPAVRDNDGINGRAIIDTARLLDAPQLRERIAGTGADLGFISSTYVYDHVIKETPGHLAPTDYREVTSTVKESEITGWLYLSGR